MAEPERVRGLGATARRRVLWGVLTLVLVAAAILALGQSQRLRGGLIADSTASAQALVDATLEPILAGTDGVAPASGDLLAQLTEAVNGQVLADGTVRSVTIWTGDGTIVFTDDAGLIGDRVKSMRTTVAGVIGNEPRSDMVGGVLRSFVPVEVAGGAGLAVEIDRSADPLASATDPWRLLALVFAATAVLCLLLFAKTFTRYERRIQGFDEDVLHAAVAGRSRAERAREDAENRRDVLMAELDRVRESLKEAERRAREAARSADDTPRLREHLAIAAEDQKRAEQERDALRERLAETGRAVEAEATRGREEVAGALAEIERLEGVKASLQDRAAKAEENVAELTKRLSELRARPEIEADLTSTQRELAATRQDLAAARERSEQAERRNGELEGLLAEMNANVRDLERRPDLSAKLEAATSALDIARDHIRALTARADEADAEAVRLRAELDGARGSGDRDLEEARSRLDKVRPELERVSEELRNATAENVALREEAESLRRASDAAGQMIAGANAELMKSAEVVKTLREEVDRAQAGLTDAKTAIETTLAERDAARRELETHREATRTELETLRDAVRSDIEALRAAVASERERADGLDTELEDTRGALARARAELRGARSERENVDAELETLRTAVGAELESLRDAVKSQRERADALGSELEESRSALEAARSELETATSERETLRTAVGAELESLRDAVKSQRGRADALGAELEESRSALEAARSELETATSELDGLRIQVGSERDRADDTAIELGAVQAELDGLRSSLEAAERDRDGFRVRMDELAAELAQANAQIDAARAEAETARVEAEASRTDADSLRSDMDAARADAEAARAQAQETLALLERIQVEAQDAQGRAVTEAAAIAELEERLAQTEALAASAEDARHQAEAQAVDALERAKVAEGLLGEAEALLVEAEAEFRRAREGDMTAVPMPPAGPEAADPAPDPARVNGMNGSSGGRRPTTKVEVDTLVRRLVQESAGRSGRKLSVYAEPVVVLAPHGVVEAIVSDLLDRSVQRTSEGNRIVMHVERAEDGALLSVEHGRPPEEDALSPETRKLVTDLGGWAAVEPHPGGGSILRVLLPRETSADAPISA
ncbi:MAG TPA: hypothetical protein VFT27_10750 [Actinomycetota bacterium]|nr:hypothetical protein [Actinomycetota bacterium]